MRTIWKFAVPIGRITPIAIPADAKVVLAALDPATGGPAIWVDLDTEAPRADRLFFIVGTGRPFDGDDRHVGSLIDRDFVWHVLERPR